MFPNLFWFAAPLHGYKSIWRHSKIKYNSKKRVTFNIIIINIIIKCRLRNYKSLVHNWIGLRLFCNRGEEMLAVTTDRQCLDWTTIKTRRGEINKTLKFAHFNELSVTKAREREKRGIRNRFNFAFFAKKLSPPSERKCSSQCFCFAWRSVVRKIIFIRKVYFRHSSHHYLP